MNNKNVMSGSINPKEKAATYRRVSTEDQAKNGMSLDVQKDLTKIAAEKDGYEVVAELEDDGKSGGSMNRKGIQEIMRLVETGAIQAVYTIHSDRIARNTLDYLKFRELLRNKEVILKCLYQPMSDDSATSRTMDTVVASFNEMQRLITSEKVRGDIVCQGAGGLLPHDPASRL